MRKFLVFLLAACSLTAVLSARKKPGIEELLQLGKIAEAQALCTELHGFAATHGWPLLGDWFFKAGDLEKALDCYGRGVPVVGLARTWSAMADRCLERGENDRARDGYGHALQTYETLIRDDRCSWDPAWNGARLAVRMKWLQLGGRRTTDGEWKKLQPLLVRAEAYCKRLEEMMLNYVCEEEVAETVDYSHPLAEVLLGLKYYSSGIRSNSRIPVASDGSRLRWKKLYDYQLVSESGVISEKRLMLLKSGKSAGMEKTELLVSHYRLSKTVYTPLDLFGPRRSQMYDYRILAEKTDEAGALFVVEILPLYFPNPAVAFGTAWLRENGRVERIELNFKSIQNYGTIIRAAHERRLVPAISFVVCFNKERNGIGFPSSIRLHDAFLDENGKETFISDVDIKYSEFRFYRVETRETIQGAE